MNLNLSDDLKIPADAVTETFAIIAKRGKGKTYTAKIMAEELFKARLPFVVMDPVGVWWGLRLSADGKGPGLSITILGGTHGDVPLEPTAGKVIAQLVCDQPQPLILDLSEFSENEKRRFVADFAEALYRLKSAKPSPLMVFVDEADEFVPQRVMGESARMFGAMDRLMRRGRARGIGMTLISQRPAVINKDVLTQTEVLIVMGITAPQDRKAIDVWVEAKGDREKRDELTGSLASLGKGEAWVWSPEYLDVFQRVKFRKLHTFDSSATPEAGKVLSVGDFATVDLGKLSNEIKATVERAKANDPAELRKEITRLKGELAKKPVQAKTETVEKIVEKIIEKPVLAEGHVKRLEAVAEKHEGMAQLIRDAVAKIQALKPVPKPVQIQRTSMPIANVAPRAEPMPREDGDFYSGQHRMLQALIRQGPLSRKALGTLAGFVSDAGAFRNYVADLKRAGKISEEHGKLRSMDGEGGDPMTWDEVYALWHPKFYSGQHKMVQAIKSQGPMTRAQLGEVVGMAHAAGSFRNYVAAIKRSGLFEERDGQLCLSEAVKELP